MGMINTVRISLSDTDEHQNMNYAYSITIQGALVSEQRVQQYS